MKKTFIIIIALAMCLNIQAQKKFATINMPFFAAKAPTADKMMLPPKKAEGLASTQRAIGQTNTDEIDISGAYIGTPGTYSVAALLPAEMLSRYVGCKVVGMRFALSQSIGKSKIFIFKVNSNNTITEPQITQNIRNTYAGWQNVFLNGVNEFEIEAGKSLLFGFEYHESEEMTNNEEGALCFTGESNDNGFFIYGDFGGGEGWYPSQGLGLLCVQLIVDISNLPPKDLDISWLFHGSKYKRINEDIDLFATYTNVGRDTIYTYQLGYQIDQREPVILDFNRRIYPDSVQSYEDEHLRLPSDLEAGTHTLAFFVHSIEGKTIQNPANDTLKSSFVVYTKSLARQKHYIEQYVSHQSPYVPYVDPIFDAVCKENSNVCLVNIEGTSSNAVDEALYLHEIYPYTYPSFTIDRFYFPGETSIAFDINDYATVVPDIMVGVIQQLINEADWNPAFASINIVPSFNAETRKLTLSVSGETTDEIDKIFQGVALTLMITEDSVKAPQMTYNEMTQKSTWNSSYLHHHLLRKYITAPLGDQLDIRDNRYHVDYEVTLPATWKAENISIVALLTKAASAVTEANVMDLDVTNSNSVALREFITDGIMPVVAPSTEAKDEFYTLDGMKVNADNVKKGIYIIKKGNQRTKVVVR